MTDRINDRYIHLSIYLPTYLPACLPSCLPMIDRVVSGKVSLICKTFLATYITHSGIMTVSQRSNSQTLFTITLWTGFSNMFATQIYNVRYSSIHSIDFNWILIMCLSSPLVGFENTLMMVPSIRNLTV